MAAAKFPKLRYISVDVSIPQGVERMMIYVGCDVAFVCSSESGVLISSVPLMLQDLLTVFYKTVGENI